MGSSFCSNLTRKSSYDSYEVVNKLVIFSVVSLSAFLPHLLIFQSFLIIIYFAKTFVKFSLFFIFFQEAEPQTEASTEEGFDIVDPVTPPVQQAPADESDPFADISQANAEMVNKLIIEGNKRVSSETIRV